MDIAITEQKLLVTSKLSEVTLEELIYVRFHLPKLMSTVALT